MSFLQQVPLTAIPLVAALAFQACSMRMNQKIPDRSDRVREYVRAQVDSDATPGIQYVVVNADSVLFESAEGFADIGAARKITLENTMMGYSMTKTFTAAAILQLADAGKIDLDAPVSRYLKSLPYGDQLTVRHLLAQTSGIPDPIPLKWVHLAAEHSTFDESAAFEEVVTNNPKLRFAPGKKYAYSNISYWILGRLVEKVSGDSFSTYMTRHVFKPLGLSEKEIAFEIPVAANHSRGYLKKWSLLDLSKSFLVDSKFFGEYKSGWLGINHHYLNGPSFGGIVCTSRAVAAFLQDQLRPESRILSPRAREWYFTQQKGSDGSAVEMTLGWHIGETRTGPRAEKFFFKEGGGAGYHTEMRIYPASRAASVVIANNTAFAVKAFLDTADAEFRR